MTHVNGPLPYADDIAMIPVDAADHTRCSRLLGPRPLDTRRLDAGGNPRPQLLKRTLPFNHLLLVSRNWGTSANVKITTSSSVRVLMS